MQVKTDLRLSDIDATMSAIKRCRRPASVDVIAFFVQDVTHGAVDADRVRAAVAMLCGSGLVLSSDEGLIAAPAGSPTNN